MQKHCFKGLMADRPLFGFALASPLSFFEFEKACMKAGETYRRRYGLPIGLGGMMLAPSCPVVFWCAMLGSHFAADMRQENAARQRKAMRGNKSVIRGLKMQQTKTIVLTGANGFCASRACAALQREYHVAALTHAALDITDRDACREMMNTLTPYAVVHSAAMADMRACEADPAQSFRVNVLGAENIALASAEAGARLIHFSTDQVYSGTPTTAPHREDAALDSKSVYGRQKQEAEARIARIGGRYAAIRLTWMFDFPARNLRTSSNLLALCRRAIDTGTPLTLASRTKRGITYVHDVVDRLPALLDAPSGVYNFGSAGETTTYEAALLIFRLLGAHAQADKLLRPEEEPDGKYADLRMDCASVTKFVTPFGTAEEGIRKAFTEYGYM